MLTIIGKIKEKYKIKCLKNRRENLDSNENKEQILINQLSDVLRKKLLVEANRLVLKDTPIFSQNFSERIIEMTVGLIKEYHCTPEQIISFEGTQDECSIFFIEKGQVEIYVDTLPIFGQNKIKSIKKLNKGESFGAISFFTGQYRRASVRSTEFCKLLYIRRVDFINLVK